MSIKEIYDKENERVLENVRATHKKYSEALDEARRAQNMSTQELTRATNVSPAQTYRVLTDPGANLSLLTMERFAAAVGKKVEINLVDVDLDAKADTSHSDML